MGVDAFECPGCGAKLTPVTGQPTVRCTYCGTTSQLRQPSTPWSAPRATHAQTLESAARARKWILWSTLGSLGISFAVGLMIALSNAASNRAGPSVPPPAPLTPGIPSAPSPAPAAAMDPAVASEAALMGRLDAYVRACINRLDDRILSSRARYRSWVEDDDGPRPNARHVYGLYTFSDPSGCAEASAAASALSPRHAAMDEAGQAYVAAVTDLHAIVEEAERYYDRNDYLDDAMARGQALHEPLLAGFNRFLVAREALLVHVDQGFATALDARESSLAPGDTRGRLLVDTLRSAQAIARESNVHWRNVGEIEHAPFAARVDGYQRQVDELQNLVGDEDRAMQSYVQASQAFALAAKELARRVDRGGGWSRGDRMMLRGVGSHWMVTGSPGAVLGKYEELTRADVTPPLRYMAPTALLSDGY